MEIKITFKNIDHTPSLDSRIEKKSKKLEKFLNGNTSIQWTCFSDGKEHFAEITLQGPSFIIHAKGSDKNLYHALDKVIAKVEVQLRKQKEKWKNQIHNESPELQFITGREEALDELAEKTKGIKGKKKAA